MSVRKRVWTTSKGESKEAWIVSYADGGGRRHIATFARKKDAKDHQAIVHVDVGKGIHTPVSASPTVSEAAVAWIKYSELEKLERSTLKQYRSHVALHINPKIGNIKLAKLTPPSINMFRDALLKDLSRPLARKVLTSLKAILRDARRRGTLAGNPADGVSVGADKRGIRKLKVGVDVPTPAEVRRILDAAAPEWRPILATAAFTGLRASELRGLQWSNIDFSASQIHVTQRADAWGVIGSPKSEGSERTVPIGPYLVNVLKAWKLQTGRNTLVFSAATGEPETTDRIVRQGFWPAQVASDIVGSQKTPASFRVKRGARPKYQGLHSLRHFYASWCLNRRAEGGLELPIKMVQERLGHASITLTADTYGHLFPRTDDGTELAAAEQALFNAV